MKTITKKTKVLLCIALMLPGFILESYAAWENVGLQNFSAGEVGNPIIAIDTISNTSYVAYPDIANGGIPAVMEFDGSNWLTTGTGPVSSNEVFNMSFSLDHTGVPYVAFIDNSLSQQVNVKKLDVNNWTSLDGQNSFTGSWCYEVQIALDANNVPYVAYKQYNSTQHAYMLNVKKFNGTIWEQVGPPDISVSDADYISIAIGFNNTPYVAYRDKANNYKGTVKKFDGTNWVNVGPAGFTPDQADYIKIGIDRNSEVYTIFCDANNYQRASVMKFDGTDWNVVGSSGVSYGTAAHNEIQFDFNNIPYISFMDAAYGYATLVFKFDGTNWINVGCPGIVSGAPFTGSMAFDAQNTPYIAMRDDDNAYMARVVKYQQNPVVIQNQPSGQQACGWAYYTEFSTSAGNATAYQWQEDSGNGFVNITGGWPYNGAASSTLRIYYPVDNGVSGNQYRCLIYGSECAEPEVSSVATFSAHGRILQYPDDVTICGTDSVAEFELISADTGVVYQWKQYDQNTDDWLDLSESATYSGTNSNNLRVSGVNASMNDSYYMCVLNISGCESSASAGLYVDVSPQITPKASSSIVCDGNELRLWGEDGYYFQWDNGVDDNVAFVPVSSATYTVNGYDWYGCPASASITVNTTPNTLPTPLIQSAGPLSFCEGDSVILSASNTAPSFHWSTGDTTSSLTVNTLGNYSLINTDQNGCLRTSSVVNVYTPTLPEIYFYQNVDCNGSSTELTSARPYDIPKDQDAADVCNSGYYIEGFSFAGINNQNTGCSANGNQCYADYHTMSAEVNPGTKYGFTFTPAGNISNDLTVAIWMDLNFDGDFTDEQELVYTSIGTSNEWTSSSFTDSLLIPDNAIPGITRMRVRTSVNDVFYAEQDGAMRYDHGETEDYSVQIGNAAPYVYSWTSSPAGFVSNLPEPHIIPSADTTYILSVSDTVYGCIKTTSFTLDSSLIISPGSYGKNKWNVFAYEGWNENDYKGYYIENSLNFNSAERWDMDGSPSEYSGFKGCEVSTDDHSIAYKRQGFPSGYYSIDIPGHDDDVYLYINDSLVYEHIGCCDNHENTWTGLLDANTKVYLAWTEYGGGSYGMMNINYLFTKPPIDDIVASTDICLGNDIVVYSVPKSSGADYYVWSIPPGAVIVSGDSTNSIQVDYSAATQGTVSVYGVNVFGAGEPVSFNQIVYPPNHAAASGSTNLCGTDSIILSGASSGYALEFGTSGERWLEIPFDSPETNYTFELSFKTSDPYARLSSVHAPDRGWDYDRELYLDNGEIYHRLYSDETINSSGTNYADDQWHHVAVVVESGVGQRIYVDGVQVASGTKDASDFDWDSTIDIGWNFDSFTGSIDNVRLWDVVLSQSQIEQNMGIDISSNPPGLIGNWRFEEGFGNSTKNNVDGAVANLHNIGWTEQNSNTYLWSTGASTKDITVSTAGTYSVVITNSAGCTASSDIITVTSNPLPSVSVSPLNNVGICTPSFDLVNGTPSGGTYSGTGVNNNKFYPSTGADTYTIVYTYTDGHGCSNTASTDIIVEAAPSVSISTLADAGICNSSFTLTGGSPSGGIYSGAGVTNGIFSPSDAGAGIHSISYTIQDNYGCSGIASTDITVTPVPTINVSGISPVCDGGSVSLQASTSNGTINWYDVASGGQSLGSGSSYTTPLIQATTTYYAEASENTCVSSRIPVTVTVLQSSLMTQQITLCAGQSINVGGSTYNQTGTYIDYLAANNGCDSTITTYLTVEASIDVSTNTQGPSIIANATSASYQWINCSNGNAIIPGADNRTFTPSSNGDYAVIVSRNNCSDTSACVNFIVTGIDVLSHSSNISVYPNPSTGMVTLKATDEFDYSIVNGVGQSVREGSLNRLTNYSADIKDLVSGVYYVVGKNKNNTVKQKLVVL